MALRVQVGDNSALGYAGLNVIRPPYGWSQRVEAARSVFVGFDFGAAWPFVLLYIGGLFLGFPTFARSLLYWCLAVTGAALVALGRGFRLEVSPRGFTLWRTWLFIPYWRQRLPLDARVSAVGGFGDPEDRVVIERSLHSEDVTLGSPTTCWPLATAIQAAQDLWRSRVPT